MYNKRDQKFIIRLIDVSGADLLVNGSVEICLNFQNKRKNRNNYIIKQQLNFQSEQECSENFLRVFIIGRKENIEQFGLFYAMHSMDLCFVGNPQSISFLLRSRSSYLKDHAYMCHCVIGISNYYITMTLLCMKNDRSVKLCI